VSFRRKSATSIDRLKKARLFVLSTHPFGNDEQISKSLLKAHLNPEGDEDTRNHLVVNKSGE
jgi:hypothetical protein